mgnify:CR=1 FL=1
MQGLFQQLVAQFSTHEKAIETFRKYLTLSKNPKETEEIKQHIELLEKKRLDVKK